MWLRSMMACATGGWSSPGFTRYISGRKRSKPWGLILFRVLMTNRVRGLRSLKARRVERIILTFCVLV